LNCGSSGTTPQDSQTPDTSPGDQITAPDTSSTDTTTDGDDLDGSITLDVTTEVTSDLPSSDQQSSDTDSVQGGDQIDATPVEPFGVNSCDDVTEGTCVQIDAGDNLTLLETVNLLGDDSTIILAAGTWTLDNQLTFRDANNIRLIGQGKELTTLSFAGQQIQSNGVDVISDNFVIQDLSIEDAVKDALRIEESNGVIIRRVKVTWTGGPASENGAYGIYPVRCTHVLMEGCEAYNAADAGLYIGQSRYVVVRDNVAKGNVAGIEIENTQFADVYNNLAEDNTGGLLIFDLPGNPVVGRDIKVHDNIVINNNRANFAPGGTVQQIPAGTGTVALASRRIEIYNNTYANNKTGDIAILSGLAIEEDASKWFLNPEEIVGDYEDLNLIQQGEGEDLVYMNYRTEDILIYGNSHSGSGTSPDSSSLDDRPIGFILAVIYAGNIVDSVIYDSIGESSHDANDASLNSNDNHICAGGNTGGTFGNLNLEALAARAFMGDFPTVDSVFQPAAPFTPFDCTDFTGGPIPEISLTLPE
jgi:parallel beta-helix repeat protein